MANLFGTAISRARLLEYVGDLSQIGGVRVGELGDGFERGVRTAEFRTGSGFEFTVLVDRGMDIGWASFNGAAIAWRSPAPAIGPAFYEQEGPGWLRGFHGGLMTSCGLTAHGSATVDQGEALGLHGRASHTPAERFASGGEWHGDEYEMWVSGEMREARVFGEYLVLRRRYTARLGESRLWIEDRVTNEGHRSTPHMMLYHCNFGYPLVDENAEWISSDLEVIPRDTEAEKGFADGSYLRFQRPTRDYREQVFYHVPKAGPDGYAVGVIVNRRWKGGSGLGAYVRYRVAELPLLAHWKQTGQTEYACGMEPTTNRVEGRDKERAAGRLLMLEPGEERSYLVEIGVLQSTDEIERFLDSVPR